MRRLLLHCGLALAPLYMYAQPVVPVAHFPAPAGLRPPAQLPPYEPTRAEILDRYEKARYLDSIATRSIFKASGRIGLRTTPASGTETS